MAFTYETGEAASVAEWFTNLEAFMIAAGWTVESGSGTQTVVFASIGEGGGRTKLHVRFRQDGGSPEEVYYRVQDDVAGTHSTTEGTYTTPLDAGGGGAAPFDYWMVADRDCVNVVFRTAGAYTGCYVGIVERFPVTVPDEEYEMVAVTPNRFDTDYPGYVLRKYEGTWDEYCTAFTFTDTYNMNPLDSSYMIAGVCVKEHQHDAFNQSIIGQLKHLSGRINVVSGLNAQDTIVTGYGGATSWWTIFGTGTERWALHTGGTLPTGAWEGGFSSTSGMATSINDLTTKFTTFLGTVGWSVVANPSPSWPIDFYLNSAGQLAGDDIWVRWRFDTSNDHWSGYVMDDETDSHHTVYMYIGDPRIQVGDFPLPYFIVGDADCFLVGVEIASVWHWGWFGMFTMYMGDPASIDTMYKVGCMDGPGTYQKRLLRGMDGTWGQTFSLWIDKYGNSSPSQLDGTSYIIWPTPLYEAIGPWPLGQPKYLHRLSGTALAVNDTVTIGARRYTYLAGAQPFAYRDT